MSEAGSIEHRISQVLLATGAVVVVGMLTVLALLVTLVCAPPLKSMAERVRNQAP